MNIKQAKEQIKRAMQAYFTKDAFGNYQIPAERQRPLFLMGPPGIGKTAVMEQTAAELGVGLVSYSMTHHTRQSALGLPFIEKKEYGGQEYSISEYTMSEIIASVYEMMEQTGMKEGILFLDEINCVSETLAPAMLQFLQYKIFGRHRVPDGWVVVTAGNPPEYNHSVREFDIATWDRLKRIDIEPDFAAWKAFAVKKGIHPAVLTYLESRPCNFYQIEPAERGGGFVTARGWVDLSDMIRLYEYHGLPVEEDLIRQYLQEKGIAKSFAGYYEKFTACRAAFSAEKILSGRAAEDEKKVREIKPEERLMLLGILLDRVAEEMQEVLRREQMFSEIAAAEEQNLSGITEIFEKRLLRGKAACSLSDDMQYALQAGMVLLQELAELPEDKRAARFEREKEEQRERVSSCQKELAALAAFWREAFAGGTEWQFFAEQLSTHGIIQKFAEHFLPEKRFYFADSQ